MPPGRGLPQRGQLAAFGRPHLVPRWPPGLAPGAPRDAHLDDPCLGRQRRVAQGAPRPVRRL
eukprot:10072405-Alexandrium_andersonii.AAC.1